MLQITNKGSLEFSTAKTTKTTKQNKVYCDLIELSSAWVGDPRYFKKLYCDSVSFRLLRLYF